MSTTNIHLPDTLPFPIKILSLPVKPPTNVKPGTRLVNYSYIYTTTASASASASSSTEQGVVSVSETRIGSWDAPFEGELHAWKVKPGDVVSRQQAKERPALVIVEPCRHEVQVNKLCALCGMDMENFDYTGRPESSRATIQMTHSAQGPVVSFEEAQRIERETAEHLLKSRRLSLIVDLDQTIVHATVDPTVGEWIAEGEAWEERRAERERRREERENKRRAKARVRVNGVVKEGEGDDEGDAGEESGASSVEESDTEEDGEDEVNPNWEALKDVKEFRLAPDTFGNARPPASPKGKEKSIQSEGCLYYVKPRPGWKEFLESVAKKYELHVYTMGTRAYAEEVCAAIDPDGRIFGGRILSRDESGSMTHKSLRRLFPCDTSMVVIIDDRADVWEWSPNLVKVIPYDFFVGIGDINSTFLPKQDAQSLTSALQSPNGEIPSSSSSTQSVSASTSTTPASPPVIAIPEADEKDLAVEAEGQLEDDMLAQNALALEAQLEERPLAKKQEKLTEEEDKEAEADKAKSNGDSVASVGEEGEGEEGRPPDEGGGNEIGEGNDQAQSNESSMPEGSNTAVGKHQGHHHKKALLHNDDTELTRVGKLLDEVHGRFYEAYENRPAEPSPNTPNRGSLLHPRRYDTTMIIPSIRTQTFAGVHILFSGVIPTNTKVPHESTEVWRMANAFGAICHRDLTREVTHVVASKRGTNKVERARRIPGVKIVRLSWFIDSIAQWRRLDETAYLLEDPSTSVQTAEGNDVSDVAGSVSDTAVSPSASLQTSDPPSDPTAISSDTDSEEFVGDDEGEEPRLGDENGPEAGAPGSVAIEAAERFGDFDETAFEAFDLGDVDWADANDEVDAAMMESDTESMDGGNFSGNVSEDGLGTEEGWSTPSNSRSRRKRLRSLTPSERWNADDDDELKSPLSKRKKIAAERTGMSRLKESLTVGDDEEDDEDDDLAMRSSQVGTPRRASGEDDDDDEDEDMDDTSDGSEEDEDDFLARELEEDWG